MTEYRLQPRPESAITVQQAYLGVLLCLGKAWTREKWPLRFEDPNIRGLYFAERMGVVVDR